MLAILHGAELGVELITLEDMPGIPDVEETGATFAENARLKAESAARWSGLAAVADDGGLVIDALGGAPGVHSHRFLGEQTGFPEKMARILEMMSGLSDDQRSCRFECVAAIAEPGGTLQECRGVCEGRVAHTPRGDFGFGYDPIFFVSALGKHMAELPPQVKQQISHRGQALRCAIPLLRRIFAGHED